MMNFKEQIKRPQTFGSSKNVRKQYREGSRKDLLPQAINDEKAELLLQRHLT
jgi:hypothetical protein